MKRRSTLLNGAPKKLAPIAPHDGMRHTATIMGMEVPVKGLSRTQIGHVFGKVDSLANVTDGGQPINTTTIAKRSAPIAINPGTRSRNHDKMNG